MLRKGHKLYFEIHERDKFLRAARLYGRVTKVDVSGNFVEHEKAHLDKIHDLGHEGAIDHYMLEVTQKGYDLAIGWRGSIPKRDVIEISMAPDLPSQVDFEVVFGVLGKEIMPASEFKTILECPNKIHGLKRRLLEEAQKC